MSTIINPNVVQSLGRRLAGYREREQDDALDGWVDEDTDRELQAIIQRARSFGIVAEVTQYANRILQVGCIQLELHLEQRT